MNIQKEENHGILQQKQLEKFDEYFTFVNSISKTTTKILIHQISQEKKGKHDVFV
jgi:hypothetical protein